jgi:putative hydrolase
MHSDWSDGVNTIEAMVDGCVQLGYGCSALTDHSYGLAIAGGLSMERFAEQHAIFADLNDSLGGRFRLLKGVEANLRTDGSVDMEPEELALFDIVIGSPHSLLRRPEDQTGRMVAAVSQPNVHILGHPRGRVYNSRPGVLADWDAVFAAAASSRVALEIDGIWDRQDLDYELASRAFEHGCIFSVDSDAHSRFDLRDALTALAHARLAGIPASHVINNWPDDALLDWSASRKSA